MAALRTTSAFKNTKVLILGLGLLGGAESAVRWFCRQGAVVRVTDLKTRVQLQPTIRRLRGLKVQYHLGGHRLSDIDWADVVVRNPDVRDTTPELRRAKTLGKIVANDTTIFFEVCPATVVAVTGTRGKSSTASLIAHILRQGRSDVVLAGNLPNHGLFDALDIVPPKGIAVLELSSFQLELLPNIKRGPHIAVMTNIKVDHLNRYGSMKKYADAKFNVIRYQRAGDFAILNADSSAVRSGARRTKAQVVWFSDRGAHGSPCFFVRQGTLYEKHGPRVARIASLRHWHILGDHQRQNLLAAVAAVRTLGVTVQKIQPAIKTFVPLPHRQEIVRHWLGHDFINDTTATTPDGTLAALSVFPRGVFIVGGTDKKLRYKELAKQFRRRRTRLVLLPGSGTEKLRRALQQANYRSQMTDVLSMSEAVHQAVAIAAPKQPIVLSPAAASFGLFINEFDRGKQFIQAVRQLS
ncbi:MAG: UDP-N-acetylmuramoyl-L-alanine--D-glutamate ligase [Candidatus Kerfeldbacteria bacterium]|nr:UDP-N-acetylmuramoyl-L-alanine--D-glutamate ligase [Candidatus Kerfeldbacteria bacterium]